MPAEFSLNLSNLAELKSHYIPFFKRGGLFIPTSRQIAPGTNLSLEVVLPNESTPRLVEGQLAWRTPVGAQDRRLPGLGLHFAESAEEIKQLIEKLLSNFDGKESPSHTI